MESLDPRTICRLLEPHLIARRRQRLEQVLQQRVENLVVGIEDVHEPQNISAVARTCEGLGIQRLLVIEGRNPYRANRVITQGCDKWLTLERRQSPHEAVSWLRERGFTLYASTLGEDSVPFTECAPFPDRVALFFGNEHVGLSATLRRLADHRFQLPMAGFSQSFNVTVAAALTLGQLLAAGFQPRGFDDEQLWTLRAEWYRKSVRRADALLAEAVARGRHLATGNPTPRTDTPPPEP